MKCEQCDADLEGKRAGARFCDAKCKLKWNRARKPPKERGRPKKTAGGAMRIVASGPVDVEESSLTPNRPTCARCLQYKEAGHVCADGRNEAGEPVSDAAIAGAFPEEREKALAPNPYFTTFLGGGGYLGEREKAEATFVKGKQYRVTGGSMSQSSSWITLEGVPGKWNTVNFDIEIHACPLIENPYVRPAVIKEDFLDGPGAVEKLRKSGAHVREGLPPVDVNAGARNAIVARVPAVTSLEAPIPRVDNSAARGVLAKVPRKSDEPAAPVVSASSILGRMTAKLPSAPVVVPRGSPLLPPSKKKS